ncbi:GDSL esterase/lipase At1g31550 isoform X2 [Helianthus annuus]|uniref:Putative SGNH hydrolase-type esterase superfamily protein n=1 Tax=Helianthus annuus TaxID=4232 RepID=A0A251VC66_HELAN|nr:GDSL esterase/lipase At1g31550 isoform X2 [Helianthus annuus]
MALCSNFRCVAGYLVVLWSVSLYANGCYTSIINFGDSLSDTGNIKHLGIITNQSFPSMFLPYGQTFFHKPTGRFSDGRLIIDFLAESLGLPLIPPYMREDSGYVAEFEHGMNYAVAGATTLSSQLLADEGIHNLVTNASFEVQLKWFKESLPSICGVASDCRNKIGHSLILVGEIGGNDYYCLMHNGKSINEIKSLVPLVVKTIVSTINELIGIGAQTLVVPGVLPLGCSADHLTIAQGSKNEEYDPTTSCLIWLNQLAEYHNQLLQKELNHIRELHSNVNIIYADYYNATMQIYRFPYKYGFINESLKTCCGGGGPFNYNSTAPCGDEYATVCDEPYTYVNWDGVHFTEAAYKVIFEGLFQGPYTTPTFKSSCPLSSVVKVGKSSSY